jgi:hypothetical protein
MEPGNSFPRSQNPTIDPYSQLNESSPHPTALFFDALFTIIVPSTSLPSKSSLYSQICITFTLRCVWTVEAASGIQNFPGLIPIAASNLKMKKAVTYVGIGKGGTASTAFIFT